MAFLQTYLRYLSYDPTDRDYEAAKKWMTRIRAKIKENELTRAAGTEQELINITLSFSDSENLRTRNIANELAGLVSTRKTDSIYLPELQTIIGEGIAHMQTSRDPMHDTSHVIRAIRFAAILVSRMKREQKEIDWGVIVASIAWHDVYRVKNRGYLYNKDTRLRKMLRKIPLIVDIDIYLVFKKDSIASALWFLKESKGRLPKNLRRKIAIAILGEHSLNAFQESIYPGISLYKTIVFSADTLDLASVARLHGGWLAVKERGVMDMLWYNRMLVLNLISGIQKIEFHPSFAIARDLYKSVIRVTYVYVSRFFPTDAKLLRRMRKAIIE